MLVLDSGAITHLAQRTRAIAAEILAWRATGEWPPLVPTMVLVECLEGHAGRDAHANAFLKTCDVIEDVPVAIARRAALLRRKARRGSAVDALVIALAEPGGIALTSDVGDLSALAEHAERVRVVGL